MWGSGPHLMVPWAHPSQYPERHHDRFSRFCRTHGRDRQTDHATPSVARPHLQIVLQRCGVKLGGRQQTGESGVGCVCGGETPLRLGHGRGKLLIGNSSESTDGHLGTIEGTGGGAYSAGRATPTFYAQWASIAACLTTFLPPVS